MKCEGLDELSESFHVLFMCVFLIYSEKGNISVVFFIPNHNEKQLYFDYFVI